MEVYVIAYNNLFCVEYQIKTWRAFCQDAYELIIVDSNCGKHVANTQTKREMCHKYKVEMLELPSHLSNEHLDPSIILGEKITWLFHNIIKNRRPRYVGIVDQDYFPFRKFTLKDTLDRIGMYGDVMEHGQHRTPASQALDAVVEGPWVLHPWLSFYRFDVISAVNMDWNPCDGFDTGGKNWTAFIAPGKFQKKDYWRRQNTLMCFPFDDISGSGPPPYQQHYFHWKGTNVYSQIQIYDGSFVHMLNSKYLDDPSNPKTNYCKGLLDSSILLEGSIPFTAANGFHCEGPAHVLPPSLRKA